MPAGKTSWQSVPQAIPSRLLVTLPVPLPIGVIVRAYVHARRRIAPLLPTVQILLASEPHIPYSGCPTPIFLGNQLLPFQRNSVLPVPVTHTLFASVPQTA